MPSTIDLQVTAYNALSSYFQKHEDYVIEIEILPPAFQPPDGILMHDGLNLGIPKKVLAVAYIEARKVFFQNAHSIDEDSPALRATKVMLLFDPEHLTAANYRKRRLQSLHLQEASSPAGRYLSALHQEFHFLNSILTSPLHRQSKSPTLWSHRVWLLNRLIAAELRASSQSKQVDFWRSELNSVCKSGERHPKNYYAWQYTRKLIARVDAPHVHAEFASLVKDWCFKHPSDISGWTYLQFIVRDLPSIRNNIVTEVLDYAITLRLTQESLWVFIRTILAQAVVGGWHGELLRKLQLYRQDLENTDKESTVFDRVGKTLRWIEKNSPAVS